MLKPDQGLPEFVTNGDSDTLWTKLEGCMLQTIESLLGVLGSVAVNTESIPLYTPVYSCIQGYY